MIEDTWCARDVAVGDAFGDAAGDDDDAELPAHPDAAVSDGPSSDLRSQLTRIVVDEIPLLGQEDDVGVHPCRLRHEIVRNRDVGGHIGTRVHLADGDACIRHAPIMARRSARHGVRRYDGESPALSSRKVNPWPSHPC